jgi:hypothetical protein
MFQKASSSIQPLRKAIERLGDMLRYALQEDGRELVEFSEEYDGPVHRV